MHVRIILLRTGPNFLKKPKKILLRTIFMEDASSHVVM